MNKIRAYRDGNRLVLAIEEPTKEQEAVIAALITGQIGTVKGLSAPESMKPIEIDTDGMDEAEKELEKMESTDIQPDQTTDEQPRQAAFVKKLKDAEKAENETAPVSDEPTQALDAPPQETEADAAQIVPEPENSEPTNADPCEPTADDTSKPEEPAIEHDAAPAAVSEQPAEEEPAKAPAADEPREAAATPVAASQEKASTQNMITRGELIQRLLKKAQTKPDIVKKVLTDMNMSPDVDFYRVPNEQLMNMYVAIHYASVKKA